MYHAEMIIFRRSGWLAGCLSRNKDRHAAIKRRLIKIHLSNHIFFYLLFVTL